MASQGGGNENFWSEIGVSEENRPQIGVIYGRRRKPTNINSNAPTYRCIPKPIHEVDRETRVSLVASKRVSWKRSLSIRGRTSIVISGETVYQPQPKQREARRKPRNAIPNRKTGHRPPDFHKEKAYFEEIDSFELMEESPSPKNLGTWAVGTQNAHVVHDLSSILERWMISKRLTCGHMPSGLLAKIWETPILSTGSTNIDVSDSSSEKTPEKTSKISFKSIYLSSIHEKQTERHTLSQESDIINVLNKIHIDGAGSVRDSHEGTEVLAEGDIDFEDLGIKKLSLTSSLGEDYRDAFAKLLMVCGQSVPSRLSEVFSQYCDLSSIVKIGEGTYGEAFRAGETVCKIVPIDGDLLVNGEVQKRSSELLEEVLLCWTLGTLKGQGHNQNICTNFIETKDVRVCQGAYDASLIKAWEDWDAKNGSENDHPKEFPEKQCYVVFILADGGRDLESFVLSNFDEARSLLVQVTATLAVAEVAFEFEHRDLHWGNILLSRNGAAVAEFTIQGSQKWAKTFGLSISIIDFTLSRINTGEAILFLDLSADPALFGGPKGDRQSETYRKMKEVTDECWEGSFPKTNVLWLQYLVDILLLKKTFQRTAKDLRDLRSLRKSLNSYDSAKDALSDPFFSELWVDRAM
ncbi:serine/threonine-protein kinase haspin isoform X1 [Cinnamomum micranthum f. kanehirae]|uniref:non-specific serine/threonine protein kinase n=1 Tax=Cinnamomum micranthum f. kanehirae TaxID=337451 RepID=A0A443NCY1_9MAGN|nr:serine/threonine-protein kinase haspin isoform X1 [Cinnamomum micranthum f. kanehirae]